MQVKENHTAARYDRRVDLLKPVEIRDAYNEKQTVFQPAYQNFPAHRRDNVTSDSENLNGRSLQSSNMVEWELRFIPNMGIKSTWKMIDVFTGQEYKIISPPSEIGRRQAIRVKTEIVE